MTITATDTLTAAQKVQLLALWNNEYPLQLCKETMDDFEQYLAPLISPIHLLLTGDGHIYGWCFAFTRDDERWFAIILHREVQGQGNGRRLMETLMAAEPHLSGWVTDHNRYLRADGTAYPSPLAFYNRLGFTIQHNTRLELPHLSAVKISWSSL